MTDFAAVTCPYCYQVFQVASPPLSELPADVDYDCEICCRPMRIAFETEDGEVDAFAYSLGE